MPRDNGHVLRAGVLRAGTRLLPKRRLLRPTLLLLAPLLLIAVGGYFYLTGGRYVSTDDAYIRYDKVQISSDVAGRVARTLVSENQVVRAGDLLFALDDEPYRIALTRAEGLLAAARNDVEAMR